MVYIGVMGSIDDRGVAGFDGECVGRHFDVVGNAEDFYG